MKSLFTKIISALTIITLCVVLTACKTNKCADGHTWKLTSTTATCYVGGVETYTCEVCKEIGTRNAIAYGHDLVLASHTDPTCKTNGEEVKKCSRCGFESKQTLLIVDHDYQIKSTTPSTCTEKGSKVFECSMCHETKTEILELKEHVFELTQTVPPTCTNKGVNTYKCKNCFDTYSEEIDLLEHNYKLVKTTPSTCTVKGSLDYECSVCHDKYSNELPLEEHKYVHIGTTPSTCVKHGSKEFECSVCHNTYSEELSLVDHKYEPVEVPATCFTHGATKEQCSVCKDEKNIQETPLLAHNFGADGYCEHCGIYETLFDETKLNIEYTYVTMLGWIGGDLVPNFKENRVVADSYWVDHTVTVTVYLYNAIEELIGKKAFTSQIDGNRKLTIQSTQIVEVRNDFPNKISLRLKADGAFPTETLTACTSFKIELSCDGYEKIEKIYQISKS